MTYRELANELGISSQYLSRLMELNIIKDSSVSMLHSYDGEELKAIRKCCLFSMLGISLNEYIKIADGSLDFRDTLKKHVEEIASDENNNSKAAIVLQNIRRDNATFEDVDPEGYLQHIRELKAQGGLFYDVNTLELVKNSDKDKYKKQGLSLNEKVRNIFGFKEREDFEEEEEWDNKDQNGRDRLKEWEERGRRDQQEINDNNRGQGTYGTESPQHDDIYVSEDNPAEKGSGAFDHQGDIYGSLENSSEKSSGTYDNQGGSYSSQENPSERSSGAYDETWSPYTDKGFGASNLGAGNWHGWSPGYGTYAKPLRARERINNGEKTCPHPFRRFAARTLDATIVTLIGGAVLRLGFRVNVGISIKMVAYCEIIFWLFEMMIEPLLLTTVGTTPGKWIMGLKVRDMKTKEKLELKQAYIRSLKLAWQGFGFMIPIYTVFKRVMSFIRCRMDDTMPWDNGIDVELVDESNVRIALVIIVIILLNIGDEVVGKQALIPKNTGNSITKEQFYENVVELMEYTGYGGDIPNFEVEERNGYVKSVSLSYSAEDTQSNRYDEMYLGFMAFAGASDGSNGVKLLMTSVLGRLKSYSSDFQDQYCGVTLMNTSDSEIRDTDSYSMLFSAMYGMTPEIPAFNQTFTMIRN